MKTWYTPDIAEVFSTLDVKFGAATREAQEILTRKGVRVALIGGLAVGAYGYIRNTKDIDFVVDEAAFATLFPILTFVDGVPLKINGIAVDLLLADEPWLKEALGKAQTSEGVFVLPVEALIAMKLSAWRPRDRNDVLELLSVRVGAQDVAKFLTKHGLKLQKQRLKQLLDSVKEA